MKTEFILWLIGASAIGLLLFLTLVSYLVDKFTPQEKQE